MLRRIAVAWLVSTLGAAVPLPAQEPCLVSDYSIDDIADAHIRMGENANAGKIVIDVAGS